MSRLLLGPTTVTTAGTRVQLSAANERVKTIQFQTRAANTGRLFVGLSDVSATVGGWELRIPTAAKVKEPFTIDLGNGSIAINLFYVDATVNGDILDWIAVVE